MTGLGNIDDVYKHYLKVVEENRKLKELLKECHTQLLNKPIREIQYDIKMAELKDLLKRIYEAIGEKQ